MRPLAQSLSFRTPHCLCKQAQESCTGLAARRALPRFALRLHLHLKVSAYSCRVIVEEGGMDALVALGCGDMRRSLNILQVPALLQLLQRSQALTGGAAAAVHAHVVWARV